jgi:hypothetical protein
MDRFHLLKSEKRLTCVNKNISIIVNGKLIFQNAYIHKRVVRMSGLQ